MLREKTFPIELFKEGLRKIGDNTKKIDLYFFDNLRGHYQNLYSMNDKGEVSIRSSTSDFSCRIKFEYEPDENDVPRCSVVVGRNNQQQFNALFNRIENV